MAEVLSTPTAAAAAADRDAAEEWTEECATLLANVLETQGEIASLLADSTSSTQELSAMKAACDTEVHHQQQDAAGSWRAWC
jgi:hypothetical protein